MGMFAPQDQQVENVRSASLGLDKRLVTEIKNNEIAILTMTERYL